MKNFIFCFIATFVASLGMAQNTETTVDTIGTPHHFGVYVGGHIYNPTIDTIWMDVTRSLDGVNFTDTVAVDTLLDGQGVAIPFDLVAPLVPSVTNWIRVGTYTSYSSSVSYDTIIVLAPDTPQTVTLTGFQQIAETGNSVTAVLSWEGGDTLSTVFIENGPTTAYANAVINFQITGSGSDTVTIPASGPNAFVYTRTHVETPGFSWSNQLTRVFQAGSTIPASILVDVDTSFSPFAALATINVSVGDCVPLTVTPTLYQSNGNTQLLQDSIFAADGVWTFPISGLSSATGYSLEVTGTSNCAAVTETANFVSQFQEGLEIVAFSNIILSQDQLQSTISFDPHLASQGTLTGTVQELVSGVVQYTFAPTTYTGPDTQSETVTVEPGAGYVISWQYTDPSGVYPYVIVSDTVFMPPVPAPTGTFLGGSNETKHSFSQNFWVIPNGNWPASATTMHFKLFLVDDTSSIELVLQDSVDLITVPGTQTIACNNLENSQIQGLGSKYRLVVWLVNGGGVTAFSEKEIQLLPPSNPNLFLQEIVEVSGNKVRSEVYIQGNGNHIILEYGVEKNGNMLQPVRLDTLGSSVDTTISVIHGPYANCDEIRIQVAGHVVSGLFDSATPLNNLEQVIEINCNPLPNSVEENMWDGLVITTESITLPSGVSEAELQIVSMLGQVVLQKKLSGSLSFSLEPGAYIFRLITEDGHVTRKIAKP